MPQDFTPVLELQWGSALVRRPFESLKLERTGQMVCCEGKISEEKSQVFNLIPVPFTKVVCSTMISVKIARGV